MLRDVITADALLSEAGEQAYARGSTSFESGAVVDLRVGDDAISARVVGDEYTVRRWVEEGNLFCSCPCPVGDDGVFCKHGVATGLAALARLAGASAGGGEEDEFARIRRWLGRAPREQIEEWLLDQAQRDPMLHSLLDARAALGEAGTASMATLKATVGQVLSVSGYIDCRHVRQYVERAYATVDLIAGLLRDGRADMARELAHYALKRGIAAYEQMDDSGDEFGSLLREVAGLHLKACQAAPPESAAFGKELFALLMLDGWGLVEFSDYAPCLGEAALKAFRMLAEKEWGKVPAQGPADKEAASPISCYRITSIMEALARESGDIDALVVVNSRRLHASYDYLKIAEILIEAGRHDEALEWAQAGHAAFPNRRDSRLVDFLADEYARLDRHEDALRLAWDLFRREPSLMAYKRLAKSAERAMAWDAWRAKALGWVREDLLKAARRDHERRFRGHSGHSLLVEIFLWEGDSEAALAEARAGGCAEELWLSLTAAREERDPGGAAEIYRERLDRVVDGKKNSAYDHAASLVAKIQGLMQRVSQEAEFVAWLQSVRAAHKAKRNFLERLDKVVPPRGERRPV